MIDANLLIYTYDPSTPLHVPARQWLGEVFTYEEQIRLPLQSILAFIRVSTNQNIPGRRATLGESLATVDSWLALANVQMLTPGPDHWRILKELCHGAGVTGSLTTDAHMAAFAIEHDATLCSADSDFARFPGLRWRNPLDA